MAAQPEQRGWPQSRIAQAIIGTIIVVFLGFGGWASMSWPGAIIGVAIPLAVWARATFYHDIDPQTRRPINTTSPGRIALELTATGGICAFLWLTAPLWIAILGTALFAVILIQRVRHLIKQHSGA